MDRKRQGVQAAEKKRNGEDKAKEDALDKLRTMEWKRNQEDTHYLNRPINNGGGRVNDLHERKKYNQDEDNYFEGTGGQRNRRPRKSRHSETVPTTTPAVFTANPPPVSAWSKKKGSALFEKAPEPEDLQEDEILQLVYEQSKLTAAEDEKRRMKKYQEFHNYNKALKEIVEPPNSCGPTNDIKWEDEDDEKNYSPEPPSSSKNPDDLHFVDTDSFDDIREHQRQTFASKSVKNSTLQESLPVNNSHKPQTAKRIPVSSSVVSNGKSVLPTYSKPMESIKKQNLTTSTNSEYRNASSINNISNSFASSLTFGDTKEVMESIQENVGKTLNKTHQNGMHKYGLNKGDSFIQAKDEKASSVNDKYLESLETDRLLHFFIKRESAASEVPKKEETLMFAASPENVDQSPDIFAVPNQNVSAASYIPQEQLLNTCKNTGSHRPHSLSSDTSYSPSDSPLQSVTPYGSLERHSSPHLGMNLGSSQNNQPQHQLNHNLNHQMAYHHPTYNMVQNMMPFNPQGHGYCLPNPNFPSPFQSQDVGNLPPNPYLAYHQHLMALQYHNAQLASQQNAEEEKQSGENEGGSYHPQSVPQSTNNIPGIDTTPSGNLPHGIQQNRPTHDVHTGKSREDTLKEINETLQRLNQLQQDYVGMEGSSAAPHVPSPSPYHPLVMGNMYPGMPTMTHIQHAMPQTTQSNQSSPDESPVHNYTHVHGIPNMNGIQNMYPNVSGMPSIHLMASASGLPQVSGMAPNTSASDELPNGPLKQNSPGMPQIPLTPMMYGLPHVPGNVNGTMRPNVPGMSTVSGIPILPKGSNISTVQTAPGMPSSSGIPNPSMASTVPGVPNVPGMSNVPMMTSNVHGSQSLPGVAPNLPGMGSVIGIPDAYVASNAPLMSNMTGVPLTQNMNEILARMMPMPNPTDSQAPWTRQGSPHVPSMSWFGVPSHLMQAQTTPDDNTEEQDRGRGQVQQQ